MSFDYDDIDKQLALGRKIELVKVTLLTVGLLLMVAALVVATAAVFYAFLQGTAPAVTTPENASRESYYGGGEPEDIPFL